MSETIKRNIAYKLRIGDILVGKPITNGDRFSFLELGDRKIIRVNIIGNIIDRYDSTGDKNYSFLTLDDGSGQIKIKAFGDSIESVKDINQGQTVVLIGLLRYFNNEIYVSPEIAKPVQTEYLLVRKLELEKNKSSEKPTEMEKEKIKALKDRILDVIKAAESDGGKEIEEIILEMKDASHDLINQEVQKLLEEGIIFEPRPGRLRYLG